MRNKKHPAIPLPPPAELAEIYLTDDEMTMAKMAAHYGVAYGTIRQQLSGELLALGKTRDELKAMQYKRRGENRHKHTASTAPCCRKCRMLLLEDTAGQNGLCIYCQPGAVDYTTFMASIAYEGL